MSLDNLSAQPDPADNLAIIHCKDRWQVYHRLKELNIPCRCRAHQPLKVEVNSPHAAILIWSVVKQTSKPRQDLVQWLKHCWRIKA
ncbi:MAG: hypothetical protein QNJ46_30870 [Leptolyngbyaceae cyanobacterium MO_188.B28]|nr:hypothetical protein [Leptolyngbyaceae cyanobacterium MO_188.B28]